MLICAVAGGARIGAERVRLSGRRGGPARPPRRLAERYFHDDPVTALIKLRQFAETLAALVAARNALAPGPRDSFDDTLRRLRETGRLPREAGDLFHDLRRLGNAAVHENRGGHAQALTGLKLARQLGVWFRRSYGADPGFSPGPFVPPPPQDATAPLLKELETLRAKLDVAERTEQARQEAEALRTQAQESEAQRLGRLAEEAEFWRAYAEETEQEKAALADRLAELQVRAAEAPALTVELKAAETAAKRIVVDEADTRVLVDAQLVAAGWEADSLALRHSLGTRPEIGRRLAIAEWPAEGGKVDYALFIDERCVGVIEAKRGATDAPAALDQARRYARTLRLASTELAPGAPYGGGWGDENSAYRTPFVFATNGRPYVKQLETKSGVWFWDARRPTNPQVALPEWFSPGDLQARLAQKLDGAAEALAEEPFDYAGLRPYQRRAVEAIEQAITDRRREVLVAMATGTGKTRMAVALMYRLLKHGRFRRILFLVDRRALGEQAQGALDTTELEGLLKFSQPYNVAGLDKRTPDPEDRVQVATVQSLVAQVLGDEAGPRPTPGRYDLIIVDEAHRGYVLDAELREDDLGFRDTPDYLSKYRRVLEHFDAVKVALTATPALHTTQIFGEPVFHYGYRQAVVDGFLADHLPPRRITTALSQAGISFEGGTEVEVVDGRTGQIDLFHTPDQLDFDVSAFNRRVYTREFNRVVAEALAVEIAPDQPGKTLIFAARDDHADMLVEELSKALAAEYGPQPVELVKKITSGVDRPLELIRRFKNDRLPQYAVTVDLLTTGIDVPSISNLVFARRVNSRILYDQMIGRATRLAPGKTAFRIFDAVDLYARLQSMSDMRPVVVNPLLSFQALADDLLRAPSDEDRRFVRDQIVVKLRARLNRLGPEAAKQLDAAAGRAPQALLDWLKDAPVSAVADLLRERTAIIRQLDAADGESGEPRRIYVSDHDDVLVSVEDVFTGAASPEDYITAFERFVRDNMNLVPALVAATQRPRELTRAELKALASALSEKGFTEAELRRAYGRTRNADIAAHAIGFVRQAALGDPLVPYKSRVETALARIEASRPWTQTQRQWLRRIGRALLEQPVGDPEILEQPLFKAKGGWPTVDRDFDDHLADVLGDLNEAIWTSGSAA